ncbi:toxin-antitoxin system TumE family protein [Paenibacillus ferrarius]|uniref:toxin-antitoxin system TumE family protein n=1 Tax=Paenibacillus ferrarius TaxID=1469647 RepID=UPI003D28E47E
MTKSRQTARPPSNIRQLERDYAHIIMDTRDGDGTGLLSSRKFTRYTFVFVDGSRLLITEELNGPIIDVSYYNWLDSSGNTILSFHSEPHDQDPRYQTLTEPYHVHPPDDSKLTNITRYPNFHHQELHTIMEHIFFSLVAAKKM